MTCLTENEIQGKALETLIGQPLQTQFK